MNRYAVEMSGIVKRFGRTAAADRVDFAAGAGEVHALLGENGAGKSTIMSVLAGIYRADGGDIRVNGQPARIRSPKDAQELGIGMVHQNFRLVPTLTALDNMVLGEKRELWRGKRWRSGKREEIEAICRQYGLPFPVDIPVGRLSVGERQRVEIVKLLYKGADILLLDEPTSVLTPGEAESLIGTLAELKKSGKTILMTTHKLKEVMQAADRISVMRKGRVVAARRREETSAGELAELMVGRMPEGAAAPEPAEPGGIVLAVEGMTVQADHGGAALRGIRFAVREGEIVGVAGVAGNGQRELAEALTGLREWSGGSMTYRGERMERASIRSRIDKGIAHVPEDRMGAGLAGSLGLVDNLLLKSHRTGDRFRFGLYRKRLTERWADELVRSFDVRTPGLSAPVRQLSGGNQQKLLLAREIDRRPKLLIAVHPAQGLDVGAAAFVHRKLLELRDEAAGVLLISEDLDEVLQLSDRILVLYNGAIIGEARRGEADRERIGRMMAGLAEAGKGAAG